ncbi:MAG TPA: 16S rRNA methyltransferase [Candidatus Limnocylindria bacterium]|nr:16S rRNA methyltransferase [Candidatus Limnocylindria bacterium]
MTAQVVTRVLSSRRYREVDAGLLTRLADEELRHARNVDDATKRVKRRLHQAVGAFRGTASRHPLSALSAAWRGELTDPVFRSACATALAAHASARERIAALDDFYPRIWEITGTPRRILDVGCGLNPIALPWMRLQPDATYLGTDVDRWPLATVEAFLTLVGQPHEVRAADATGAPPTDATDVALLLKLIPTLDRQDPEASARLLRALNARHAVVSFPARSLGGRGKGMERTYRSRLEELVEESGRVQEVAEASVPNELVFVLTLDG